MALFPNQKYYGEASICLLCKLNNRISKIESILQIPEHALITKLEIFFLLNLYLYLNVTVLNTVIWHLDPQCCLSQGLPQLQRALHHRPCFLRVTHTQWLIDAGTQRLGHLSPSWDNSESCCGSRVSHVVSGRWGHCTYTEAQFLLLPISACSVPLP